MKTARQFLPQAVGAAVILVGSLVLIGWMQGSGFDVLRQIKRDSGRPAVIVLTSYGSLTPYRTACAARGVDAFFNKTTEICKVPDALEALKR